MQLLLIGEILPLAAAAEAKMGAERGRIRRRLRQELHDLGFGKPRFFPGNPHPHTLAGDGVIHEDHETVHPAQGFAAKGQLFYAQIDLRALGQRGGGGRWVRRGHVKKPGLKSSKFYDGVLGMLLSHFA